MKRLYIAACGLLLLGACAVEEEVVQDIGGVYVNGVFVAYCSAEPAPMLFTKEGFPIVDDQACIPEPEVLGVFLTSPRDKDRGTPADPVTGIVVIDDGGCTENCGPSQSGQNNGWGNGDQGAPGKSDPRNNAENGPVADAVRPGKGGGKPSTKGIDHLSTAEQAFMLWDYNNRVDYEAYWQWLLDNGLVIAE